MANTFIMAMASGSHGLVRLAEGSRADWHVAFDAFEDMFRSGRQSLAWFYLRIGLPLVARRGVDVSAAVHAAEARGVGEYLTALSLPPSDLAGIGALRSFHDVLAALRLGVDLAPEH